ncbi:putative E3 ubiquitin-protein ligase LIN-1 isoform X1 [Arachis stenosperma]|uniref:putative E3 ubiquitin-protein ligase LIN-1 isoform X1 n=1 Tax=Arachis stenosperma TaxID=217475 RepID=UPI0025ABADCC|nr:putative E3 ubiquitin-protein ligase LIN-1 isoform X1 [Arachis stenosperma]
MTTAVTAAEILRHTTAFLSDVISNRDLRHRLISILHRDTTTAVISDESAAKLAADTLETAIMLSNFASRSCSLSLAEKLLLPLSDHPLPFFLLSLVHTLHNRHLDAAVSLLRFFRSNPSLARSEIAPVLYDRLFSLQLLSVFRWLLERRAQILSSSSVSEDATHSLSKVSEEQASKLRELERKYEEILDENCRAVAARFEEVLASENASISPPLLARKSSGEAGGAENNVEVEEDEEEQLVMEETEMIALKSGHYDNPIWSEREEASIEFLSSGSCSNSSYAPFYPRRVSPTILKPQNSSQNLASLADETESSLVDKSLTSSSSESEAEREITSTSCSKGTPNLVRTGNKSLSTPKILKPQKSAKCLKPPTYLTNLADEAESLDKNLPCSYSESEAESEEKDEKIALLEPQKFQTPKQTKNICSGSMCSPDYNMEDEHVPPEDFVCPLTSNLFDDPVTLETGHTFERHAIEEWLKRGNLTCPITRKKLRKTRLPKTNLVLKQIISSWKEQNLNSVVEMPCDSPHVDTELKVECSTSANSVISEATLDGMMSELRNAINKLYMSEVLAESEMAVLQIEKIWRELNLIVVDIHSMLSKPAIINGFMGVLLKSFDPKVLQTAVFLLTEMGCVDSNVIQTLSHVDTDVEWIKTLFKKGVKEAVVLMYLLKPSTIILSDMAAVEALIAVVNMKEEEFLEMCLSPKTAAVLLLAQVVGSSEESIASSVAQAVLSEREIEAIVGSLGAEWTEERVAAVEILLKCMQEDGTCRNIIADKAQLSTFLESLVGATEGELFKIVKFLSELVKLNRRTFNEQILHIIKEEGPLSTMHTLLISLQTAHQFHFPVVAGLLLQLDLLVEQTKMSIYSEEAIDTLISCLRKTDYPAVQLEAAKIIASLQGRFNYAGKSLSREVLLERAGLDRSYNNFLQMDQISNFNEGIEASMKEENAAEDWERKAASVLVSHDCGLLFEALADGLKSQNEELRSACFISATWLIYMITILPDTGIQGAARVFFLKHFIFILKSAEDTEDRILAMLALKSFLHFDDGLRDLTSYAKDILKALRELEGFSPMASEIMKVLVEEPESKADIWIHKEVTKIDCSGNGEVLSIICFEDKIFSGHSDGTIKVWKVKESIVDLLQEIKRHTKDVTSLAISESGDRLYSGSLDRTVKVWSIEMAAIHHVQEHDMKDHIHNLVVTNSMCCFSPHGSGIKVKSWNGESKLLNSNKHAKCLALVQGKLYCGCHDSSIQEIDLATGKLISIQSGSKKLLGKANPIHALKLHGEFIYATSSSFDGSVIKIWNTSNNNRIHMVGSLQTSLEVRAMAVSSELIYLGCKGGAVEIWDRKKYNRINTLHTGSNYRVVCMALNSTEDILVIGTSDGQIQAWGVK